MLWRKKWMNPFKRYRCYICGKPYHPGDCAIVSSINGNILQQKRTNALLRIFTRSLVTSLLGREATLEQAARHCPHCDNALPSNDAKNYTIAIVGDVSSGKSLYIASCIYQLLQGHAAQMIGFDSITGMGQTNEKYHDDYFEPVYLNKRKVIPTIPGSLHPPLVYELGFTGRETINLLFYDASGEDLRDPALMVQYSHFVLDASAIIFLADPVQMPGIVQTLPDHLKPTPDQIQKFTTGMVLDRVMRTFKQGKGLSQGKKVETPIAITVSKSDLLKFAAAFDHNSALYLYDNTYANQLDTMKFAMISSQVEELIKNFGDQQLLLLSKQFQNVCFFAVTATGWSPDSNGEFPPLEPKRCLDPLLWTLWKLGIIDPDRY